MPLVTTFETRGGLHAHIAFIGSRDIAERLKRSSAFGEFIQVDSVTVRAVSLVSTSPRKKRRRRAIAATLCLVVAFPDHIASTAAATVCVSPAILSATQSRPAMSSPGSTPTRAAFPGAHRNRLGHQSKILQMNSDLAIFPGI